MSEIKADKISPIADNSTVTIGNARDDIVIIRYKI